MRNDLRSVVADILAGVVVVVALLLHALGRSDAFTDTLALLGLAYLGLSGTASKTANGQTDRVNAVVARVDDLEPVVATNTVLATAAAAGIPGVPVVSAPVAVVAPPPTPRAHPAEPPGAH